MLHEVNLILATEHEAEVIHQMKYKAFLPLYEKYHDDQTSPVKETLDKVIREIQREKSDYYLIQYGAEIVGGVRVLEKYRGIFYISPLFILPSYQSKGIGYAAMELLFQKYPQAVTWRLDTILQEEGNCRFYEKCGFCRTGKETRVNDKMTLVDYEKINMTDGQN